MAGKGWGQMKQGESGEVVKTSSYEMRRSEDPVYNMVTIDNIVFCH